MKKPIVISLLLIVAIAASFLLPKQKYASLNILENLNIPTEFPGWTSIDFSKELNLQDDRYNFISDVFARVYQNRKGEQLLLLVLDAGNFHNPKVCYRSSGFSVKELGDAKFSTPNTAFKANALLMERQKLGMYMYYWLCIDKKIVDWTGQKVTEFWSSLSQKKKTGLMVRMEIPTSDKSKSTRTPEASLALGREFLQTLSNHLTTEQKEYLFGK
jgi:EpsI family protein